MKKLGIFLLICLFLATRLPRLSTDEVNPDAVNWHYRSQQFVNGLKYLQFEKTYQHYHPGVTLMWITGSAIELYKQLSGVTVYTSENFVAFHLAAKLSLVAVQLGLTLLVCYLLTQLLGFRKALLVCGLFTVEPFFLGNSRLFHMDVLFTLLIFVGLLLVYLALSKNSLRTMCIAGSFLALAFLTRSIGVGALVFSLGYIGIHSYMHKGVKRGVVIAGVLIGSFCIVSFLLFPALWVKPVYYLGEIFREGERVGVRGGHTQIVLGEETEAAGWTFYPLVLLLKTTPVLLLGSLVFFITCLRNFFAKKPQVSNFGLYLFLAIFYAGYLVVMSLPSKKLDRYMVVVFPFFALITVPMLYRLYDFFSSKGRRVLVYILFVCGGLIFYVYPFVRYFPYLFLYTSPLVLNGQIANTIIAQKPFGMGIFDLKKHILTRYGNVTLGFIDTKPMEAIYPNSKVFDVRVSGASNYDLLVLGINESFPEKVLKSDYSFTKDSSVYFAGLEYWRIYVKTAK